MLLRLCWDRCPAASFSAAGGGGIVQVPILDRVRPFRAGRRRRGRAGLLRFRIGRAGVGTFPAARRVGSAGADVSLRLRGRAGVDCSGCVACAICCGLPAESASTDRPKSQARPSPYRRRTACRSCKRVCCREPCGSPHIVRDINEPAKLRSLRATQHRRESSPCSIPRWHGARPAAAGDRGRPHPARRGR